MNNYFDAKISLQGKYPSLLIESLEKTAKTIGVTVLSSKSRPNKVIAANGVVRFAVADNNPNKAVRDFITFLNLELENLPEEENHPIAWWTDIFPAPTN